MGIKEDYLAWKGEKEESIDTWHEFVKEQGMAYSDEYYENVICAQEKEVQVPIELKADPGFIGSDMDMVDMST